MRMYLIAGIALATCMSSAQAFGGRRGCCKMLDSCAECCYETRKVTCYRTECRTEYKEVERQVTKQVPHEIEKTVDYTVMVTKQRTMEAKRCVLVPVVREEKRRGLVTYIDWVDVTQEICTPSTETRFLPGVAAFPGLWPTRQPAPAPGTIPPPDGVGPVVPPPPPPPADTAAITGGVGSVPYSVCVMKKQLLVKRVPCERLVEEEYTVKVTEWVPSEQTRRWIVDYQEPESRTKKVKEMTTKEVTETIKEKVPYEVQVCVPYEVEVRVPCCK